MLLFEEPASRLRNRDKLGKWGLEPWVATAENTSSEGGDGDCRIFTTAGDLVYRLIGVGGQMGGFSHESEHDLAVMVSDFLENGSGGADSICSSDSDCGFPEPAHLSEKISVTKRVDTDSSQWKGWNWRSEGDLLLNGAYFTPSGAGASASYAKASSLGAKSSSMVASITSGAGALPCIRGSRC